MQLDGRTALVTGATSGIGKAIALRFGAEGAHVAVHGRDRERGDAVVAGIRAAGGEALFLPAELADEDQRSRLVTETVEHFGALTILVNNVAGTAGGRDGPAADVGPQAWRDILEVDLVAPADLSRLALEHLAAAEDGVIVNISSRVAARGTPGHAAYTASKGGLEALTRSIATDYAKAGVRCNAVQPGYVINERRDQGMSEERRARLEAMQLTRLPTGDDIAAAALYLAGPAAETVTGQVLPVDGGSTIARARTLG